MPNIFQGIKNTINVTVMNDGEEVMLSGDISGAISKGKKFIISDLKSIASEEDAMLGLASFEISSEDASSLPLGNCILTVNGDFGVKRFSLTVFNALGSDGVISCLDRDIAISIVRSDKLARSMMVAKGDKVTDDYLWRLLRAAEKDLEHRLKVTFTPCSYFPIQPSEDEVKKMADEGVRWAIDPGYDYTRKYQTGEAWGMLQLRNKPIIDVEKVKIAYPRQNDNAYDYPKQWLRIYHKYAQLQIVPDGIGAFISMQVYSAMMLMLSSSIPMMFSIQYTAGIQDINEQYPELLDAIYKLAVVKLVEDKLIPQSGSISADGLSQSISVDTAKYKEMVDSIVNGDGEGNSGLMVALHGIRLEVV